MKWRVPDQEVHQRGLGAGKMNRDDAMDHSRWRKLIKDG